MADEDHIRNPVEWTWDQLRLGALMMGALVRSLRGSEESRDAPLPTVCRIKAADLWDVLAKGFDDFGAYRTDVIFLCLIYPIIGLMLVWLTFGYDMLPLLFPLASGFALVGPVAAVGLYEMSRRRERGIRITWIDAFGVVRSPGFGSILVLGLILLAIFLLWLFAADAIYDLTLGPEPPASITAFARDIFTTGAGWAMIVVGVSVGFLFALLPDYILDIARRERHILCNREGAPCISTASPPNLESLPLPFATNCLPRLLPGKSSPRTTFATFLSGLFTKSARFALRRQTGQLL
jgi:hypothetical protein